MLSTLRIRGLALLDDVTLELSPGFNVLTGETGAGKSIIVDALALLRGGRARLDALRSGADTMAVDAQFELEGTVAARAARLLERHGLPTAEGAILVQRSVPRTGRGRCLVQAELTTQAVLGELGEVLIDICSQHEHHSLTQVGRHLELLDGHARLDAAVAEYGEDYRRYRETAAELEALRAQAAEGGVRADYLRFQIEELERISPESGELVKLGRRLELLRDAQRWIELGRTAHEILYESEDSILARLATLRERALRGADQSPRLAAMAEQLGAAAAACEEADREAERLLPELELEPADLERAEERMSELVRLQRKHGCHPDELASRLEAMRAELDTLSHAESRLAELEAGVERLHTACVERATRLRASRERSRAGLARAVVAELAALQLPAARFEARLEPAELGPRGSDRVEFQFSANPGEPPGALSRIASGGELSRVLLAIKGVLAVGDHVATYVFDEIDAGVGGAVAVAIGQRLARAARSHQVLCITHLPQIAAFARTHFRVEKRTRGGRTLTSVKQLSDADRLEELARMLGGARVTDTARTHARQLLAEARAAR